MCCLCLSCLLRNVSRAHLAAIFLWMAAILCSVSFVSPYWKNEKAVKSYRGMSLTCSDKHFGLLAECCSTKCTWIWENGFKPLFELPDSQRVILSLFLSGLLLLLPVLVMSPFRFCCQCCKMSVGMSRVCAIFTFLAACLIASANIYFFCDVIWQDLSLTNILAGYNTLTWAFNVGVVGTCFTFTSAVYWNLDSKRAVGSFTFQNENQQKPDRRRVLKR